MATAKNPFRFYSRSSLTVSANRKAKNLRELLSHLKEVPESVIYQHTHHFLLTHQHLVPEPPNDFAYWVGEVLKEDVLAEELMAVDPMKHHSLGTLRQKLLEVIGRHILENPGSDAHEGSEFYFMRTVVFVYPIGTVAHDLQEFLKGVSEMSYSSLYYHVFEAKLRLPDSNDFSLWLGTALGEDELAREIARFNPYSHTLGRTRRKICELIERRLNGDA